MQRTIQPQGRHQRSCLAPDSAFLWDLCGRSTTFASLRPCVFAFSSSKRPDLYGRSTTNSRISTGDPLPLRLCALASLRSLLPSSRISAGDPLRTAGSLREIHYLCVFAPLRLCVFFFQAAGSLREIHYEEPDLYQSFRPNKSPPWLGPVPPRSGP